MSGPRRPSPSMKDLCVDIERIKQDILALAEIGRSERDRGIYRMAFTDADMEAKRWLLHRIADSDQRQLLVDLLEQHRQTWSEIPFSAWMFP